VKNKYHTTFFTLDDENKASSRVRAYWLAEELRKKFKVKLVRGNPKVEFFKFLLTLLNSKHIIFQKSYTRYHFYLLSLARILGKKTYVDIDDSPSRTQHPITMKYFAKCCQSANGVLAGSPFLVEYCKTFQKQTYYLPTSIKMANYQPKLNSFKVPVIGWIGNGNHYKEDLIQILLPVLKALKQSFKLKLIGVLENNELIEAFSQIKKGEVEFVHQLNWKDPNAVSECLSELHIGVYPLLNNEFNKYKCGFKALEYMAMALPVLVSPNSANNLIVQDAQSGFVCNTKEQWIAGLNSLLADPQQRQAMGQQGLQRAQQHYNSPVVAEALLKILESNESQ
jgi:glycosyltransferase involved in cell wall biosynthesis